MADRHTERVHLHHGEDMYYVHNGEQCVPFTDPQQGELDPTDVHSDDAMLSAAQDDEPLTMLFAETVRALNPFDGVTYPELLRHAVEMQVEMLQERVARAGYKPVGSMYLRIDIEQAGEPA